MQSPDLHCHSKREQGPDVRGGSKIGSRVVCGGLVTGGGRAVAMCKKYEMINDNNEQQNLR